MGGVRSEIINGRLQENVRQCVDEGEHQGVRGGECTYAGARMRLVQELQSRTPTVMLPRIDLY